MNILGKSMVVLGLPLLSGLGGIGYLAAPEDQEGHRSFRAGVARVVEHGPQAALQQGIGGPLERSLRAHLAQLAGQSELEALGSSLETHLPGATEALTSRGEHVASVWINGPAGPELKWSNPNWKVPTLEEQTLKVLQEASAHASARPGKSP